MMGKPPKKNDALQVSHTSINEREALLAKVMVVDRVFLHPWCLLPILAMASLHGARHTRRVQDR